MGMGTALIINTCRTKPCFEELYQKDLEATIDAHFSGGFEIQDFRDINLYSILKSNHELIILSPQFEDWGNYDFEELSSFRKNIRGIIEGSNTPLLGICGGYQLIIQALQGDIKFISDIKKREEDKKDGQITYSKITKKYKENGKVDLIDLPKIVRFLNYPPPEDSLDFKKYEEIFKEIAEDCSQIEGIDVQAQYEMLVDRCSRRGDKFRANLYEIGYQIVNKKYAIKEKGFRKVNIKPNKYKARDKIFQSFDTNTIQLFQNHFYELDERKIPESLEIIAANRFCAQAIKYNDPDKRGRLVYGFQAHIENQDPKNTDGRIILQNFAEMVRGNNER